MADSTDIVRRLISLANTAWMVETGYSPDLDEAAAEITRLRSQIEEILHKDDGRTREHNLLVKENRAQAEVISILRSELEAHPEAVEALRDIERHHLALNAKAARNPSESWTLRRIRAVLSKLEQEPAS